MNRIWSLVMVMVMVSSGLAGCAGIVKSDVTVFHAPELAQSGKAYAFVPLRGQAGNLEYATYRNLVGKQLSKHGYHLVPLAKADYAVALQYSVDSWRQVVESMPVYGQTGVSSSTTSGTMTSLGGFGTYSGTTTYTPTGNSDRLGHSVLRRGTAAAPNGDGYGFRHRSSHKKARRAWHAGPFDQSAWRCGQAMP